jgi:hypothetical protein
LFEHIKKDEFGIKYQSKMSKSKGNAAVPTALDEFTADIAARLLAGDSGRNEQVKSGDIMDDEFDIVEENSDSAAFSSAAVTKALEIAAASSAASDAQLKEDLTHSKGKQTAINDSKSSFVISEFDVSHEESEAVSWEDSFRSAPIGIDVPIIMGGGAKTDTSTSKVHSTTSTSSHQEPRVDDSTAASTTLEGEGERERERGVAKSILTEAQHALAGVREVYGQGLGDQEVALLHSTSGHISSTTTSSTSASTSSIVGAAPRKVSALQMAKLEMQNTVLEEGDEDAEEEEEQEEKNQKNDAVAAAEKLEAEWSTVGEDAGAAFSSAANKAKGAQAGTTNSVTVTQATSGQKRVAISYEEALQYFVKNENLQTWQQSIVVQESGGSGGSWFSSKPSPIAYPGSNADLELPFLIAQVDYNPQSEPHLSMLLSIYDCFVFSRNTNTSTSTSTSTSGSVSFEKIGFQGSDPRTDLNRSMKMLSVLQVSEWFFMIIAMCDYCFILNT